MKFYNIFFALLFCAFSAQADELKTRLQDHIQYLSSDALEGRGIGTKGLDLAATYIADHFKAAGLAAPFDGSYFQPFEMGWGVHLGPNNFAKLGESRADTSTGIMPMGFASPGEISGPVLFAGYGIIAPEYNYDDFKDVESQGAIVLCMSGEPGEYDTASVFEGLNYTAHAALRSKAGNAKLKGAIGLLIVEGPLYAGTGAEQLAVPRPDEPYMDCGLPAMRITRTALSKLFPEFELEKLQRSIDSNIEPRSMTITDSLQLTMRADLTRETVQVKNVGGLLPGNDTIIVVGAHYDHLGYGQSGSLDETRGQIHNGADDNASGVAAVMECAGLLKANPVQETVLFVAFTAEETGLGGSGHLVKHFPGQLDHVRAMINLDMVGRLRDEKLTVSGCNTASEFDGLVKAANKDIGLEIVCKGDGYGPSDHMNFYLADRPVLFMFTGAHEDYHRSTDDFDKINYDGAADITRLSEKIVRGISDQHGQLTFVKSTEPAPESGGRFRAWFGSIPDYSQPDSLIGVLLSGVRPNSPAEKSGMKQGDLLLNMGEVKINNIYDFVFALRRYAPGDSVGIRYKRGGEEIPAMVVLGSPPK